MNFRTFSFLTSILLTIPLAHAKHYKLFVLTGQSNSLGTTNGGESDPTSGSDPADQHVIFSWHNVVSASQSIGHSGETLASPTSTADFTTLQDQQGGVYGGSATHWAGEVEFARSLYRAGMRDFGIIKASRGGGGNTNWHKASGGHMYQHILDTVDEAVSSLEAGGHTFEIVGLMYLQGESDNTSEIPLAGTRLKELTDNLRADLKDNAAPQNLIASNMHTVAAGTTAAGAASMVNQAAIAASTSYINFFPNSDLTNSLAGDGLHLNKQGKTIVGRRWAQAFLNASITGISRQYGNLVFIGDSITQGGNGNPSYRYQVFKNLANANVPINATTGYQFVGSLNGAYAGNAGSTPDVNGQAFENNHDGHWGWRAFWQNGRVVIPSGVRGSNRGEGTILNWTGQASPQEYLTDAGTKDFPDLTTSGTGVATPYTSYTPDTAVIMIGINDIGSGAVRSTPSEVKDDIGTMIDQLRGANPNVRIHVNQLLDSNSVSTATVNAVNDLLPALVDTKNTDSSSSPVWLIDASNGFNPTTMTYDNTHPNTTGEEYVGDRISGGLSIIEMPVAAFTPAPIAEKSSDTLGCFHFEGSDIYNSGSFASNWATSGTLTPNAYGTNDLQLIHPSTDGRWLEGTSTGWSTINHSVWTYETRIKFDDITTGFSLWLGTGTDIIQIEIQPGLTRDLGGQSFTVNHTVDDRNDDGEFHTFKVTHDPTGDVYHLWRDGELLTPVAGAPYDSGTNDNRLIMGDTSGVGSGDNFDVTIDYVEYCIGFKGNEIYNGTSYINNWTQVGSVSPTLVSDDLRIVNGSGGGSWIAGTNTGWSANSGDDWTFEIVAKFDSVSNGFILWLGAGSGLVQVAIYDDKTEAVGGTFSKKHDLGDENNNGAYHTFRVANDSDAEVYHVFRDGKRLTPINGVPYDGASNNWLILGDYTGGIFGNGFDASIDSVRIDYSGVWIPEGTDTDDDGISDLWEDTYFNGVEAADATADSDGDLINNLNEYLADTHPGDQDSFLKIQSITETSPTNFNIVVPNSSANREYRLYSNDDLVGEWTTVAGLSSVTGTGADLEFDVPTSVSKDFFRVEVTVP